MARVVDIEVRGADQLVDLSQRMRRAGQGEMKRAMNKAIRDAVKPTVKDLKSAVMAIESRASDTNARVSRSSGTVARAIHAGSRGAKHGAGLRATIARAIQTKIKISGYTTGLRLVVNSSKLPPGQKKLPAYLDSRRGWRHPVYGNRNKWVEQTGSPWWDATIQPQITRIRNDVLDILKDFAQQLGRRGR